MSDFPIDLGLGVSMSWVLRGDQRIGLLEKHPGRGGEECSGYVTFDLPAAREADPGAPFWTVESWEPLTISPSVLCRACGNHGFIRGGRWVPA